MTKKTIHLFLILFLLIAGMSLRANAQNEITLSATNDYDYRGLSQTDLSPALQLDFVHIDEKFHADIFLSNVNFSAGSGRKFYGVKHTEIAYTAGFTGGDDKTIIWDFGASYFTYPGWRPDENYAETYITATHKDVSVSGHYTWDYSNVSHAKSAYYYEINYSREIKYPEITFSLHMGYNSGQYWNAQNGQAYTDYSIGVARKFDRMNLTLRDVGTISYHSRPGDDAFSGKNRIIATLVYNF